MAGIGLYGVYYSKATLNSGVVQSYNGISQMGKAIAASYEPASAGNDNNLWANNAIAEVDATAAAGGTLSVTVDRVSADAAADLFGLSKTTKTVTVAGTSVTGTGFSYAGSEVANPCGVAFIRWNQENNVRDYYEVVIFAHCTFQQPSEEYATYNGDNGVEWQTPELSATVAAGPSVGTYPWREKYVFPSEAAAIQYITDRFAAPGP